jgi:catechol 2,3-dioxygenase-like lactoylglutathione lyase family enzyme
MSKGALMTELRGILETALYANDLEKAEIFYSGVLGLERIGFQAGRHVFFRCGQDVLLLFNPESTSLHSVEIGEREVPLHGAQGSGHMAFRVSASEFPAWRERLATHGVAIELEIISLPQYPGSVAA